MADLPIACTLTPGELKSRGAELLPGVVARAVERWPIKDVTGPDGTREFLDQLMTGR